MFRATHMYLKMTNERATRLSGSFKNEIEDPSARMDSGEIP